MDPEELLATQWSPVLGGLTLTGEALAHVRELATVAEEGGDKLRGHRPSRLRFLRRLLDAGSGTLRRRIRGKVGFFTAGEKDGGQRLACDARMPNQFHRRAPKAHLGTPAALAALDLSEAARGRAEGSDAAADEADLPHVATIDLTDSFYQFTVVEVCEWFGVDFPETASTWGVDKVFNPHSGQWDNVAGDDQLFFCFTGLAMGWTFALYFCQAVMAQHVSAAVASVGGHADLIADRSVPPQVADGRPAAAVYVDNATVIGSTKRDTAAAFDALKASLSAAGLSYHEVVEPTTVAESVGLQLRLGAEGVVRHTDKRAWRLYQGLRGLSAHRGCAGRAMERIVGHLVNYFGPWLEARVPWTAPTASLRRLSTRATRAATRPS